MAMGAERSKLHNFNLPPFLKWGNSRLLRCMKEKPIGDNPSVAVPDRRSSAVTNEKGSSGKREWRGSINQKTSFRKSLSPGAGGSGLMRALVDGKKHGKGIEAFGAKLVFDLQAEVDKVRVAVGKEGSGPAPAPPPHPAKADTPMPWNLRTRRAACKPPTEGNGGGKSLKIDVKKSKTEVNRGKMKLSVPLSKREIEEDFLSMAGRPPSRRPKKRPKIVQSKLDSQFPGLWLTKIKPCMYKVPDADD